VVRDRPIVDHQWKVTDVDRFVLIPMTFSDLERGDVVGQIFPANFYKYAGNVFDMV